MKINTNQVLNQIEIVRARNLRKWRKLSIPEHLYIDKIRLQNILMEYALKKKMPLDMELDGEYVDRDSILFTELGHKILLTTDTYEHENFSTKICTKETVKLTERDKNILYKLIRKEYPSKKTVANNVKLYKKQFNN